jgi:tRNA A37 threonylcarbamoyladenosine dehydratase
MPTSLPKILVKKKITLDDLAALCMREFTFIHEKIAKVDNKVDAMATATKQDFADIRSDISGMKSDMANMSARMATKEDIDDIKRLQIDHMFRIQRLEQVGELD